MARFWTFSMAAVLALGLTGAVSAADVTGTWTAEFDSQIGVQKYTYELKVEGEKLTGTATGERMGQKQTVQITEGSFKGDKVSFVEPLTFEGQELRITYSGTLAGDELKLTRDVGGFASETLVAKRKKD